MRIVLADDHGGVLEATRRLLQPPEFDVIATLGTSQSALNTIIALKPDCAVLDISMPDFSGIEVARRLILAHSKTKVVLLTVHEDAEFVDEALAAGAFAYVLKSRMALDLKGALTCIGRDERFISPSIPGVDYASLSTDRR